MISFQITSILVLVMAPFAYFFIIQKDVLVLYRIHKKTSKTCPQNFNYNDA